MTSCFSISGRSSTLEADFGRTYALGQDPIKHRLVATSVWLSAVARSCSRTPLNLTAGQLYDFVAGLQNEFNEWSKVQVIYTPKQMAETKAKLATEIDKMSAAELQQFVNESESKLKLVLGKDADEARAWLGQYLSLMSDGYRKQFIGQVPDFVNMTSAQIRDEYLRLRSKLLQQQQAQAAFDANSTQVANAAGQANAAAQQAAQQAAARSGGGAGRFESLPKSLHPSPGFALRRPAQHEVLGIQRTHRLRGSRPRLLARSIDFPRGGVLSLRWSGAPL